MTAKKPERCNRCGVLDGEPHRLMCDKRTRCECGAPAIRGGGSLCAPCARKRAIAVASKLAELDQH